MNRRDWLIQAGKAVFTTAATAGVLKSIPVESKDDPKKDSIKSDAFAIIHTLNGCNDPNMRHNYLKALCDMANNDPSGRNAKVLSVAAKEMWRVRANGE